MKIAICDDDIGCCKKVQTWLIQEDIETKVYYTTEELLADMSTGIVYDIIFLDIDFVGISGVEAGQEIRRFARRDQVNIVFISGKQGYAMELFEIEPLNFHVKPLDKKKILRDVEKVKRRIDESTIKLRYKNDEGVQKEIAVGDILYLESNHGKISVHTRTGGNESFRASLYKVCEMLNTSMGCQCHRSYWVNLTYVRTYLNQKLYLYDGTELNVGREYRDNVKEKWISYRTGGC